VIPASSLVEYAQQALVLATLVSLPVIGVAALVGLLVAAIQAASQIQDPTIAHLPRVLAVTGALVVLGPWIGMQIAAFAERVFVLAR
jgi:type III secretory pathway component EscS